MPVTHRQRLLALTAAAALLAAPAAAWAFFSASAWRTRSSRSSIWPLIGLTETGGSTSPVGRMIWSATPSLTSRSKGPGVAETKTVCPVLARNS